MLSTFAGKERVSCLIYGSPILLRVMRPRTDSPLASSCLDSIKCKNAKSKKNPPVQFEPVSQNLFCRLCFHVDDHICYTAPPSQASVPPLFPLHQTCLPCLGDHGVVMQGGHTFVCPLQCHHALFHGHQKNIPFGQIRLMSSGTPRRFIRTVPHAPNPCSPSSLKRSGLE